MAEYFIQANSFAAPFFSDASTGFITADTPAQALEKFAAEYKHPCGLYSAACYRSADAMHKGETALARWICNHARKLKEVQDAVIAERGACSTLCHGPGNFEVSGTTYIVEDPKAGSVITP